MSTAPSAPDASAFRIDRVGPTSAQLIANLQADCFDHATGERWSAMSIAQFLSTPGTDAGILLRPDSAGLFIRPTGFTLYRAVADEAELMLLGVRKSSQRLGFATALTMRVMERCQDAGLAKLFLEVRTDNAPAVALYAKLGFTTVGRRKNYYTGPNGQRYDALTMLRLLN